MNNNNLYIRLYKHGIASYIFLTIFSLSFYKERVIFADIAYHLFHILKDGDFLGGNYRYGAVVTQIFPYMCSKLSVPLNTTMIIYSVGFALYYLTCYILCGFVLKQYKIALVLLLSQTLFVTDSFYWIQSELPQGLAFICVLSAVLTSFNSTSLIAKLMIIASLSVFAVFFHPVVWIPATYMAVFFMMHKTEIRDKRVFYSGALIFAIAYFLKLQLLKVPYESNAMSGTENIFALLPRWAELPSSEIFLQKLAGHFIWIPLSMFIINIVYLYRKNWLQLLFFNGFIVSYVILVTTTYGDGSTVTFYFENLYLPLGIVIALSMIYDVFGTLPQKLCYALFVAILLSGVARIYHHHHVYTNRLQWERELMDKYPDEKLFVQEPPAILDTLLMTWATPYEFWLLSTTERNETRSIYVVPNTDDYIVAAWNRTSFVGYCEEVEYKQLPKLYFNFRDTTSRYVILKNGQLTRKPY